MENKLKLTVGLSALGFSADDATEMKKLADAGIRAVEISFGSLEQAEGFNFSAARDAADKYDITLWSLHLPFVPFKKLDPTTDNTEIRNFTFRTFLDIIKKGTEIGVKIFVAHPSVEPIASEDRQKSLDNSAEFFSKLADEAEKLGAVIALEDLPRTCIGNCSDEILYMLGFNEKLRACFDTNHILSEEATEFIRRVGSKIITLHVSDYDFVNERHWLPGEGDVAWQSLYGALCEVGYNGVWLYELGTRPKKGIDRRPLEYADFYNNAQEIFSGKRPTAIGKRWEKLDFWDF